MTVWALLDGRPGNDNQTLAIAEQFVSYQMKTVDYNFLSKLPNPILTKFNNWYKLDSKSSKPDAVISAGRKLAVVAKNIKQATGCKAYHIMKPELNTDIFDLVFIPEHDDIPSNSMAGNIVKINGSINRVDEDYIVENYKFWLNHLPAHSGEKIGVLIGNISPKETEELVEKLNQTGLACMVVTSRRTKSFVAQIIKAKLVKLHYLYEFGNLAEANPYPGILALSDYLVVTADSVGMISEACSTGKPVYIHEIKDEKKKFIRFRTNLYSLDYAKPLLTSKLEKWPYKPLRTRDFVIQRIKEDISKG